MFKGLKRKVAISAVTLGMLSPVIGPATLEVSASESDQVEFDESDKFDIVSDTILFDNDENVLYEFDSNEDMLNHIETANEAPFGNEMGILVDEWEVMDFNWLTSAEVQELADDIRHAQAIGDFGGAASAWMYKIPAAGATVATISYFMSSFGDDIIAAANNNQSITIYRDQRVNWDGYSARTRTRVVAHN